MASQPIPQATPVRPPLGEIKEVFLSATVADLDDVRLGVAKALRNGARIGVYLQEDWNAAAGDTVLACLSFLQKSSAYLGIFGFRYGWVPTGTSSSITSLECEWALQRWHGAQPPPIFLFVPRPGSEAERALREKARQTLRKEFPKDDQERRRSMDMQADFVDAVKKRFQDKYLTLFSTIEELTERAICAVLHWNIDLLKRAPHEFQARYTIPPAELGAIGRRRQLRALERALDARGARDDAPAFCVIVHGNRNSGLSEFRARLAAWEGWQDLGYDIEPGCPPGASYRVTSLIHWALEMVARGKSVAGSSIETLATTIADRLERGPVVLLLQDLDGLAGGLSAFHAEFWSPLRAALAARWKRGSHRFSMIAMTCVAPRQAAQAQWNGDVGDPAIDYSRLLVLPELAALTADDVEDWLHALRVPKPEAIAQRVIGDGIPSEVYDALQRNGFWKQIVERSR